MKRSAPMKRTAFRRAAPAPRPVKTYEVHTPRVQHVARPAPAANAPVFNPQPKVVPVQHQGYMAIVRTFPCERCGWFRKGFMQFCHADMGKGISTKTDCRRGWSGCPPCHELVGSSGKLGKQGRRDFEDRAGSRTRARVRALGRWPPRLPPWPQDSTST